VNRDEPVFAMSRMGWHAGRMCRASDLDAVVELLDACFVNPWTREMLEREIERSDVSRIYGLRSDGALAGFCSTWLIGDELHINNLAVRHADRRRGAATFLLRHILRDVARRGARSATLEVRESNVGALRLYQRLGFVLAGRRPDYYRDPSEDALILWLDGVTGAGGGRS
jgi:ribosomal-protein-alanine N-acetyltransferase